MGGGVKTCSELFEIVDVADLLVCLVCVCSDSAIGPQEQERFTPLFYDCFVFSFFF